MCNLSLIKDKRNFHTNGMDVFSGFSINHYILAEHLVLQDASIFSVF